MKTKSIALIAGFILSILVTCIFGQEEPNSPLLIPESMLPEYEAKIDHARLIKDQSGRVFKGGADKLGKTVYMEVCFNCHGDLHEAGSLPNSMRFGTGKFQRGSDPYSMYETITRGWRLMVPQLQLTPKEKYAVIHYIRKTFLKPHNPSQYFKVNDEYLASLPQGKDLGPEPSPKQYWSDMDYGPYLMGTFEIATSQKRKHPRPNGKPVDFVPKDANIAYKAIAIRLDAGEGGISRGRRWVAFEHDSLRVAGVWEGKGFIDWQGINFNGRHVIRPRTIGEPLFETADAPGWAHPETGTFEDKRFQASDGFRYGPMPRDWGHYKGLYRQGDDIVIAYTVGTAEILEHYDFTDESGFVRHLNIGKSTHPLTVRLANAGTEVTVSGDAAVQTRESEGFVVASIPPESTPVNLAFAIGDRPAAPAPAPVDLTPFTKGGAAQWPVPIQANIIRGDQDGPFQWDTFRLPAINPWKCRIRLGGVDFTPDGKAALICTWDGDVWKVEGIHDESATATRWRRIASGLFQPLGIKLIGEDIYVSCRDQIVKLNDLNGDGETDFYENFNSDHQVSEHFHEFAMGLQADAQGNLYYAKSARHARPALIPHHGTLLKVSADGSKTEILAKGFRAANGVCLNPDGTFFVTDQEGHWNPMNRINHVVPGDGFYGNMWGYGAPEDSADSAMEPPLCWVEKRFDRSPAELLWVESEKWGALNGKLLHLSYGHGRVQIVPHETINGRQQGGMCRLPIPDLPTGIMRGRFHPSSGHLFVCGLSAWSSNQSDFGGLFRIRATGKPSNVPVSMRALKSGVELTFSDPLDPESVKSAAQKIQVKSWDYKRSASYGSKRYNEKAHAVSDAQLSEDGKVLMVHISGMAPCWQMSINYQLKAPSGEKVTGEIQHTVHELGVR